AATAKLDRVTISGNDDTGAIVQNAGKLEANETVVRATAPAPDGTNGQGITAYKGGLAVLSACAIVDSSESGVVAVEAGSRAVLDGSIITGTKPDAQGDRGFGASAESGGAIEATRSAFVANTTAAVAVLDPSSKAT